MRIEQLQYLAEVAYTGSFTAAADKLHVSQPNISYAISSLEEELGAALFKRTRAGTQPTEIGSKVIEKAQEILLKLEELKELANPQSMILNERLMIGAISGVCTSFLPRVLSVFGAKHPYVELELFEGNTSDIEERVLEGKLDIGLVGLITKYTFKNLIAEKFMTRKIMACVGAGSPLANYKSVSVQEILNYPIIGASEHMIKEFRRYGTPVEVFHSSRAEAVKRITAEGVAVSFYMDIALKIDPYVLTGQIVPIPIEETMMVDLYWIRAKGTPSAASEAFLKELLLHVNYLERMMLIG